MIKQVSVICMMIVIVKAQDRSLQPVEILRFDSDVRSDGYKFAYETSDGTSRQEEGILENAGSEEPFLTVSGQYSYVAPDGKTYTVVFTAGPNGFQPKTTLQ